MSRYPNAENGNVDASDQGSNPPFYPDGCLFVLDNDGNPVDDDLHEKLNLYAKA